MTTEAFQKLGHLITRNAMFDLVDQIISLVRLEGEELLEIALSMTSSKLDRAAVREAAKVARQIASKAAEGIL